MAQNCSELRPQQTTLRVAAAFLTCPAETVLENDRIDQKMAAIGIVENLKKEENVGVARGEECEVHTSRLGTRGTSRASGEDPNAEGEKLWQEALLECVLFPQSEKHGLLPLGTRGFTMGSFGKSPIFSKFTCDVVKETIEGALRSGFFVVAGPIGFPFFSPRRSSRDPACVTWYCRMYRT